MRLHFQRNIERYWIAFFFLLAAYLFISHRYIREPHRHTVGYFLSGPIYLSFTIFSVGMLLSPIARCRWKQWTGWLALDVSICTFLIAQSMKLTIPAPRPSGTDSLTGFPSGHTMFAFALAFLISRTRPKLAPLWFAIAAAVGWSRVDVNAHYPYQVFFGALFGLLLGFVISGGPNGILFPRFVRRRKATAAV